MTPKQFRWWLAANEPELSTRFEKDFPDDDFCWGDVAFWLPPTTNHDKFVLWLLHFGEPRDLINFSKYVIIRDDIRDELIRRGSGPELNEWLYNVSDDEQVLNALVKKGRPRDWYYYLRVVGHNQQVLERLVGSHAADMLKEYLLHVDSKNVEVRQALIRTGDAFVCANLMFEILHQNWEFFDVVRTSPSDREWLAGRLEVAAAELRHE